MNHNKLEYAAKKELYFARRRWMNKKKNYIHMFLAQQVSLGKQVSTTTPWWRYFRTNLLIFNWLLRAKYWRTYTLMDSYTYLLHEFPVDWIKTAQIKRNLLKYFFLIHIFANRGQTIQPLHSNLSNSSSL